ncbi:short chain dehydrogenase [Usnea florida]
MSKVILLISGGNAGIGYETVKKLSADHPESHQVLMGTRDLDRGESALKSMGSPPNVSPIQLDITQDSSIDSAFRSIENVYGKLDILINNAGTAGLDVGVNTGTGSLPQETSLRQVYEHVYRVNVISTAVLTDKMLPLLEKSLLPKIIFVSSILGSTGQIGSGPRLVPLPWYNSSKAALNHLSVFYSKKYPKWKINACCPGLNATGLNSYERTEELDPKNGAIIVCRLVTEDEDGSSGTFSDRFQSLPW